MTKKLQISEKTIEPKPTSNLYTAKAIAADFGFDASGIEKYYYPEACDLYQSQPEVLKDKHLFTQTFYDLIFLFRQHRMRERCMLNEAGLIVRHAPIAGEIGKPVLRKNEARMNAIIFRSWFWEMNPELIPLIAEDAPQTVEVLEVQNTELVIYTSPIYEEATSTSIEGTLVKTEEFGMTFSSFRAAFIQQFRNEGKAIAAEAIEGMQEEIKEATQDFFGAMQKATKRTT